MIGERNLAAGWPCQLGRQVWGGGKKLVMITVMKIIIIGEMETIIIVMITTIVGCGEVRKLALLLITTTNIITTITIITTTDGGAWSLHKSQPLQPVDQRHDAHHIVKLLR